MPQELTLDALGTRWWISCPESFPVEEVYTIILDFQRRYSRFDQTSDLGQLNDKKCFNNPSPEFISLLHYGIKLFDETEGLFNMSVGARLEQNGYGNYFDPKARISSNLTEDIVMCDQNICLAPHLRLDFGGFGKGWLIDEIGKLFKSSGVDQFIINGGGDILVGDTCEELFIEHPFHSDEQIGSIFIQNEALTSSSRQKRTWKNKDGKLETHIVDTMKAPEDVPISVHIRAKTALEADTFSTVFLLAEHRVCVAFARTRKLEYMEIDQHLRFWHTPHFGFLPNS
jgi:thiamine biosynthesis lipoprotein